MVKISMQELAKYAVDVLELSNRKLVEDYLKETMK